METEIKKIFIIKDKKKEKAFLIIREDERSCYLTLSIMDNVIADIVNDDFFSCFSELRRQIPEMIFLCKGAKINVYPSRMSRQMSRGMTAYECTKGKPALRENIVHIFDYDDENISSTPEEQERYHKEWLMSIT
ncbi:hypothetical protein [Brenneria corticis]|uniref:Uncharacterized protein n=1 Tax=Brenneria corticis TaxID=2173106 RepID=A0A2U1TJ35_9GAMM|nr:hypothetical protein [Brenneria sp. CFCC 11842]PWC09423.1 hypothetical protein DDT56_23955 [Brenneria sp. CFCC 11842]